VPLVLSSHLAAQHDDLKHMFNLEPPCTLAAVVCNFAVLERVLAAPGDPRPDASAAPGVRSAWQTAARARSAAQAHQRAVLAVYAVVNMLASLRSHRPVPLATVIEHYLNAAGLVDSPLGRLCHAMFGGPAARSMYDRRRRDGSVAAINGLLCLLDPYVARTRTMRIVIAITHSRHSATWSMRCNSTTPTSPQARSRSSRRSTFCT